MQLGVDSRTQVPLIARVRPWIALLVAAIVFALIPIIGLPLLFALPLIGWRWLWAHHPITWQTPGP